MTFTSVVTLALLVWLGVERVNAWGLSGHRIVALVASEYYSEATHTALDDLIGQSLYNCTEQYPYSPICYPDQYSHLTAGLWSYDNHFATSSSDVAVFSSVCDDGDACSGETEIGGYCNAGEYLTNCNVVAGIEKMQDEVWLQYVLGETNSTADENNTSDLALKTILLGHWAGDIAQPLHVDIRATDEGGNLFNVSYFGNDTCEGYYMLDMQCELHLVWDTMLIRTRLDDFGTSPPTSTAGACQDPREYDYAHYLVETLGPLHQKEAGPAPSKRGKPSAWATESLALSSMTYMVKEGGDIGRIYYDAAIPVVEARLFLAGHRLASMYNFIFEESKCDECVWHAPLCEVRSQKPTMPAVCSPQSPTAIPSSLP